MKRRAGLRWAAVLGPGVIAGGFEAIRHAYLDRWLPGALGNLTTALLVTAASSLLLLGIFRRLDRWEAVARRSQARQAVLEERERIAADLHDYVSQSLFYLNVQLEAAAGRLDEGEQGGLRRELDDMRAVVGRLYERVRRAIFDLKSPGEGEIDFPGMVRRFVTEFQERSGVAVELVTCSHRCRADCPGAELELLRILQEAVTNAHRHGRARRIRIALEASGERDLLTVEDDGCGFDPETAPGVRDGRFGIALMRERARRLGGRLEVHSRPGHGTVVLFERREVSRGVAA